MCMYLCRYSHVIRGMSRFILPPFSVHVKSATSSSWGYPLFARAKQTLTQDIQPMLFHCWASVAVVEKLTAPTSCLLGTWPAALVIREVLVTKSCCIRRSVVRLNSDQFNYK